MQIDYAARRARLAQMAQTQGVEAVLLVPGANMRYYVGLNLYLSQRPTVAIFRHDALYLIIPQLELAQITPEMGVVDTFAWSDKDGYAGAFRAALDALGLRGATLGVDGMTMRVTELFAFLNIDPSLGVAQIERELIRIRSIKQPDEIALMRQAVAISEAALAQLIDEVRPGMTERQIADRLDALQKAGGAHALAFETLAQTGDNATNPHGSVTDRVLREGESLLIDFGCKVSGYPADITRTFCYGEPSAELAKIYDVVAAANEAARNIAAPGIQMGAVDRAARTVIVEAGYGDYFTHRTGHGLGLDVHEPIPQIAQGNTDMLEPGMTFTIEPGIYIPGVGGVRLEDNVLVTERGLDVLTRYPKTLRV